MVGSQAWRVSTMQKSDIIARFTLDHGIHLACLVRQTHYNSTMAPPDSRHEVGGLCSAKAEAVSHDCKRTHGAGIANKWLMGTVLEVLSKQGPMAKRATMHILALARYQYGNTTKDVEIALQSLQAQNPKPEVSPANNNTNTNSTNNANASAGETNNNDEGAPPAADTPLKGIAAAATTTIATTAAADTPAAEDPAADPPPLPTRGHHPLVQHMLLIDQPEEQPAGMLSETHG